MKSTWFAGLALIAAGTAQVHAQAPKEPDWLAQARAREVADLKLRPFTSKDKWFKARAPGKVAGDIVESDGSYTVEIDLGTDTPVFCEVVPEGFDLSNMMRHAFNSTLQNVEALQGAVEARQLESTDAGVIGDVPYLRTDWIYVVRDKKGQKRAGGLKQVVLLKSGHGVYCAHADIGYLKTFDTLTRAIAESFDAPPDKGTPFYKEVFTATLGSQKVGVAITTLTRDAEGDIEVREETSFLVRSADGGLSAQDATHIAWTSEDAQLINASHFTSSDGDLETSLSLKHDGEAWQVEGELQGKKISKRLAADADPGNWLRQSRELRELLAGEKPTGKEHHMWVWLDDSPETLLESVTTILEKSGEDYAARTTLGPVAATLTLDPRTGSARTADASIGPVILKLERVYVSGTF